MRPISRSIFVLSYYFVLFGVWVRARARGGGLPGRLGQLHPYARIPSTIPSSGRKITSSSCRPGHTARPPPSPPGRSSCRCAHGTRTPGLRPQTPPCLCAQGAQEATPHGPLSLAYHTVHHSVSAWRGSPSAALPTTGEASGPASARQPRPASGFVLPS